MKATVRFDDVFEGEDLPDIYRQVLEYLQKVVLSEDLEAFVIDDGRFLTENVEKTK